jgi:hypothetical protein
MAVSPVSRCPTCDMAFRPMLVVTVKLMIDISTKNVTLRRRAGCAERNEVRCATCSRQTGVPLLDTTWSFLGLGKAIERTALYDTPGATSVKWRCSGRFLRALAQLCQASPPLPVAGAPDQATFVAPATLIAYSANCRQLDEGLAVRSQFTWTDVDGAASHVRVASLR